ncbi:Beta-barrel assembly-enhancing protease [Halioglobus japonicus]|nr:Beta-barrel assembly-enhancing protease [Halioglobus japonicus]
MIRLFAHILLLSMALSSAVAPAAEDASVSYEKAVQAYAEGEYDESYIHLKNALQKDPNLLSARLLLAQVYFNAGDIYSAEKESAEALLLGADINLVLPIYGQSLLLQENIDKLMEIERVSDSFTTETQFEWALLKGQGYLLQGEPTLARSEFERAATILPNNVRSNNTIAVIYMNSDMIEDARALIEQSLALDAENAKTWQLRGELAFREKEYEKALEYALVGFDLDPEDIRIQRSLAQVYMQLGDRGKTKEYLDLILEQSPEDPAATLVSAILLIGDGDSELGDSMLANLSSKLARFDDGQSQSDDTMMFIRASAEYIQGNDENASALLNAYLLKNRTDLAATRLLADIYLRNNQIRRATELLSSRESEVSSDPGLSIQLLSLYTHTGDTYRAKELLQKLKQNGVGDNPYVIMLEAELIRSEGQLEEALNLLNAQELTAPEPLGYGLLRGVLQLALGENAAAQQTVTQLQKTFPGNVRVNNFAAVTYLTLGNLDEAQVYIEKALQLAPGDVDARFNQAMLYKKRGDLAASSKVLKGIIEQMPSNTKALILMARIAYLQGRFDEAIEWSDKVYAYDSVSVGSRELQLEIYTQTGNWEAAKFIVQKLVSEHPYNVEYLLRQATIAMEMEEVELAQNTLSRLYPMWKQDPEKMRELAAIYVRFNNPEAARKSLDQGLSLEPESYSLRLDLARLDFSDGDLDTAQSVAETLQAEFGPRTGSSLLLGDIALARGEPELAQTYFLTAFQLDTNNIDAIVRLYELGSQGIAAHEFTDVMTETLNKSSLPVLAVRLVADSYLSQGNTAEAARYYEKLLDLEAFSNDPAILNNLANIYAEDDLDKALVVARRGLAAAGDKSAALLDTVGWILSRQGESKEALSYLRKAYAQKSTDPEIRYHLGVTLLALGRTVEAQKELKAAVNSGQEFAGREEAQRLVTAGLK